MPNKEFLIPISQVPGSGGSGGGVTSFTGDGSLITNTASTGAVTVTLGTLPESALPVPTGGNTAGVGSFWGGFGPLGVQVLYTTNASAGATANQTYAYLFYLPFSITITRASIYVAAVSASTSQFASVGLYTSSGTKLFDSGTFNVSTGQGTGVKTNTVAGVSLTPGFLYYVFTTNSTDASFEYSGTNAANGGNLFSANGQRTAKGTASTNGAQNTSLGTLTTTATTTAPQMCLFEP